MQWDRTISVSGVEDLEFEALAPLYEQALRDDEDDFHALCWLAHAYTRLGRIAEGLELDLRLVALLPDDPTIRYNLACSYALLGRVDDALETLSRAIEIGYRDSSHMRTDEDLAALRSKPRFQELLASIG
jgi:Flp pilus assembly protein TadD